MKQEKEQTKEKKQTTSKEIQLEWNEKTSKEIESKILGHIFEILEQLEREGFVVGGEKMKHKNPLTSSLKELVASLNCLRKIPLHSSKKKGEKLCLPQITHFLEQQNDNEKKNNK